MDTPELPVLSRWGWSPIDMDAELADAMAELGLEATATRPRTAPPSHSGTHGGVPQASGGMGVGSPFARPALVTRRAARPSQGGPWELMYVFAGAAVALAVRGLIEWL